MRKIFTNALLQRREYKVLFGGLIGSIVVINIAIFINFRLRLARGIYNADQAHEMSKVVLVIALCSSVIILFFTVMYLQFKNTRVVVGPGGIAYLSMLRKIRARWKDVNSISFQEKQHGKVMFISSRAGSFIVGPQYVDTEGDLPDIRFVKNELMLKDKDGNLQPCVLEQSEIYKFISQVAPEGIFQKNE